MEIKPRTNKKANMVFTISENERSKLTYGVLMFNVKQGTEHFLLQFTKPRELYSNHYSRKITTTFTGLFG